MSIGIECDVRVARLGLAVAVLLNLLPLGVVLAWLWATHPPLWGPYALLVIVAMTASTAWHLIIFFTIPRQLRVLGRDLMAYSPKRVHR